MHMIAHQTQTAQADRARGRRRARPGRRAERLLVGGAAAGGDTDADDSTYTWWDPYPQHDEALRLGRTASRPAATEAGVTIERTAYDTTALTNQALLAAQEGTSPDVILLDNPAVSTLADTGMLTTVEELGLDTSAIDENLLAAGVARRRDLRHPDRRQHAGALLQRRRPRRGRRRPGLDHRLGLARPPRSRRSRAPATRASRSPASAPRRARSSSCPGSGAPGADLRDLDSPEAVEALDLWKGWLDEGYAPELGDHQLAEHRVGGVPHR